MLYEEDTYIHPYEMVMNIEAVTKQEWAELKKHVRKATIKKEYLKQYADMHAPRFYATSTDILRKKTQKLMGLIEHIVIKEIEPVAESLADYDIHINEEGDIWKVDALRLVTPTLYNLRELDAKVEAGNNPKGYPDFEATRFQLIRDGFDEKVLYPRPELQSKNPVVCANYGMIPLSQAQELEIYAHKEDKTPHLKDQLKNLFHGLKPENGLEK